MGFSHRECFPTREKPLARLSPQLPGGGNPRTFICGGFFDVHMHNKKELTACGAHACGANHRARSAQFRLRRELPCTRVVQILPAAKTTRTSIVKGYFYFVRGGELNDPERVLDPQVKSRLYSPPTKKRRALSSPFVLLLRAFSANKSKHESKMIHMSP